MIAREYLGFWKSDAPLTKAELAEDHPILESLKFPEGMTILRMEVWVHGRLYEWEKVEVSAL